MEKKKRLPKGQRKKECSRCGGLIDKKGYEAKRKYCFKCEMEYQRLYRPTYKQLNPVEKIKVNARLKANIYLRRGKLIKQPCSVCGDIKSEMHHNDYNKPLSVVWFCRKHHKEFHKKIRNVL